MRFDRVAIALRPRNGWEAIDLGIAMTIAWGRSLWLTWFAITLPLALVAGLVFHETPGIALLLLWWLLPLFDRYLLHLLSRRVFGEPQTLARTLTQWREILTPGLFSALTWRRPDPTRSFKLPITLLERQTGRAARERRRALGRRLTGYAVSLHLMFLLFEFVLFIGASFLLQVLIKPAAGDDSGMSAWSPWQMIERANWGDVSVGFGILSLLEPFYVAAGFALYLNRRILLEGWDIEVGLRRLAARQQELVAARRGVRKAAAVALLAIGGLLAPFSAAWAEGEPTPLASPPAKTVDKPSVEKEPGGGCTASSPLPRCVKERLAQDPAYSELPAPLPPPRDTEARRAAVEVFADPLFGKEETRSHFEYRWRSDPKPEAEQEESAPGWLKSLLQFVSSVWQYIVWLILGAIVVALLVQIAKQWQGRERDPEAPVAPAALFGLAISPESLPADVAAAALAQLAAGHPREALSLVYRASLSRLVHDHGMRVAAGDTEAIVMEHGESLLARTASDYFADLVGHWSLVAYAKRLPPQEELEGLCRDFDRHFGKTAAAAATVAPQPQESAA